MKERFAEEKLRASLADKRNELEAGLSKILKSTDKITSQEQSVRSELNDVSDQLRTSALRIDSLLRKEKALHGELKIYTDKLVLDRFTYG